MGLLGSITIPASQWIWPAVIAVLVLLMILLWTYWRAHKFIVGNKTAFVLKLLGILFLALLFVEPLQSGKRAKTGANMFIVAADNSRGMNVVDDGQTESRAEKLSEILDTGKSGWLGLISDEFQLREYFFDSRLERTMDFANMTFDGKSSAISTMLQTITQRYSNRPLAGILLLSDGIATDITDSMPEIPGLPPVYPLVIGDSHPQKDLSLDNITVNQSAFEDTPVTIQADIEASGYAGKTVELNLVEASGQLVEQQSQKISRDQQKVEFNFSLKPEKTGILFYNLEVQEETDSTAPRQTQEDSEATLINNKQTFIVDRGGGPYRILYVSGRPNWEYKFLREALGEDEQVQLVGLIRVAKREPKFNWLGHTGEDTNPLYRGFNNADELSEQYDQPVIIRLNTRDKDELSDGFPTSAEELYQYHAIIIDDLEAEFFTNEQMELIRRFVSERGGGFMMLGGMESFEQGGYQNTTIEKILPIRMSDVPAEPTAGRMYMDLTREGLLLPWARLRDNQIDEQQRLSQMPYFRVLNRFLSTKAGASVVTTVSNEWAENFPALSVQRYGNGRSASLTIGDVWRWGMKESNLHEDMNKMWRQLFRYLVSDVPERVIIKAVQQPDQPNQAVKLQVTVRDKDFEYMDNVNVVIDVNDPEGTVTRLKAEPKLEQSGLFEASYIPRYDGGYLAKAVVTAIDGNDVGSAQAGWAADLDAQEFRSIRTNQALLEQIARQSNGRIIEADELEDFARGLPNEEVPITEAWTRPLWDSRPVSLVLFILIILCFAGEWAFRRWRGMP